MNIVENRYLDLVVDCFGHMRTDGSSDTNQDLLSKPSLILIYGGTIPTRSAFDSGWASLYEPVAGSEVLVKYTAQYSRTSVMISVPNNPSSGTYVRNGTATWAAILPAYVSSAPSNQSYGNWTWGNTSTNPIAILCDVTEPPASVPPDPSGVIQLVSTTVSGSAPTFYKSSFVLEGV